MKKFRISCRFSYSGTERVVNEIKADMRNTTMNRLIQGDVGCGGKTIVAFAASVMSIETATRGHHGHHGNAG